MDCEEIKQEEAIANRWGRLSAESANLVSRHEYYTAAAVQALLTGRQAEHLNRTELRKIIETAQVCADMIIDDMAEHADL